MQADADDRKCAEAFREYVLPVQMYSMLKERSKTQVRHLREQNDRFGLWARSCGLHSETDTIQPHVQPVMLQRSLSYTAAHAALARRSVTSR